MIEEPNEPGRLPTVDLNGGIESAIATAADLPEIRDAAAARGITRQELVDVLTADLQTLAESARPELSSLEEAERAVERLERNEAALRRGAAYRVPNTIATVLLVVLVVVVVQGVVALFTSWRWVPLLLADVTSPLIAAGVSIAVVVGFFVAASRTEGVKTQIHDDIGYDEARAELRERRDRFQELLRERVVVPAMRAEINRRTATDQSTVLTVQHAPGLTEAFDLDYEVPTSSLELLRQRLAVMYGGSIGIAGPRGCGKSTLVAAACEGRLDVPGWHEVFGVAVAAPVVYEHEQFLLHLLEVTASAVLSAVGDGPRTVAPVTRVLARLPFGRAARLAHALPSDPLARAAYRHRDYVRYQRERSLQAGTQLGVAKAASISGSAGVRISDKARSLPQLVDDFRGLVSDIAASGRVVVVAVDEIDKIDSGESARLLLNDLKSIFGVAGCFFLVTVSEDAMTSFERRGQPLRDVFDSAFDDIIAVAPLRFDEAERLLRRRVIGYPSPFAALCLTLSGGIARDVIRYARATVIWRNSGAEAIDVIAERLVLQEAAAKGRAAAVLASQHRDHPLSDSVMQWLELLEDGSDGAVTRLRTFLDAREVCFGLLRSAGAERDGVALGNLRMLAADTAAWAYHTVTVAEVFGQDFDWQRFADGSTTGWFDLLARARGVLPRSAKLSWEATTRVRELANLATLGDFVRPDELPLDQASPGATSD